MMEEQNGFRTWYGYSLGKKAVLVKDLIVYLGIVYFLLSVFFKTYDDPLLIVFALLCMALILLAADFIVSCIVFRFFMPDKVYYRFYAKAALKKLGISVLIFVVLMVIMVGGGIGYYLSASSDKSIAEGTENSPEAVFDSVEQAVEYISTNEQIERFYDKREVIHEGSKDSLTATLTLIPHDGYKIRESDFSQYSTVFFTNAFVSVTVGGRYFEYDGKRYAYYYFNPACKDMKIVSDEGKYFVISEMSPQQEKLTVYLMGRGRYDKTALKNSVIFIEAGIGIAIVAIVLCKISVWFDYQQKLIQYYKENVEKKPSDDTVF